MGYREVKNSNQLTAKDLIFPGEENSRWAELLAETISGLNKKLQDIEPFCIGQHYNEEIYREVSGALDSVIPFFKAFEEGVKDRKIIKCAQFIFRDKTNPIFLKSYYFNRARNWPRGYQGDYITMENCYKNIPLSIGIGYYLDLYLLNSPLGKAVRNRIKMLEEMLRQELQNRKGGSVLNIACGSCRELMGLAVEIMDYKADVTCIDNDEEALRFSMKRLSTLGLDEYVKFFKYNAVRMFDVDSSMSEFRGQDIIYSVGFFDYLPSDFLVRMFKTLYNILNPGGVIIVAFKDADRYDHRPYHWIVDWDGFLQRNPTDFYRIFQAAGIPSSIITEKREPTGIVVFYTIHKK
ncbi:MAG: class I SAM-dependent methyltransferase [Thermodesulfovibrionales bacterium]|nr:class I SAM-dependent methyltransferase [Thermodesulfovibrionales bacterium]